MYLKQADLFWGVSQHVIQSITAKAVQQEYQPGDIIFKSNDPADCFYVMIKGRVRLELRPTGCKVYSSDRVGEVFGWSALIGRKQYSATVVCEQQTMVLKFHTQNVHHLFDQDAESAAIFYRQLACVLGNRLLAVYELLE
ncbi:MAG: cyclic nucleotide-binding domain-containing protein [Desulfobacteraceae bacterium]|jgi:signal-transduction protein with cAMP-binding, CBS, and nucleotidyltransferase domain